MNFKMKHLISIRDLDRSQIDKLLDLSMRFEPLALSGCDHLKGKILANLFFEPSTRTRLSFEIAMKKLGGDVVEINSLEASSISKGETLTDTIRVVSSYCDIIAIRHPREGAARLASLVSDVPVINAGDGAGQHPTQTLLDLYTIKKEMGTIDGLKIGLMGDLRYARTIHSLAYALGMYDVDLWLISPPELRIPQTILEDLSRLGVECRESDLANAIDELDVLYVTRIQRERFPDEAEYRKVIGSYRLEPDLFRGRSKPIVLHPLPRVDEISPQLDSLPVAKYFKQVFYGIPVRMGVIWELLKGS